MKFQPGDKVGVPSLHPTKVFTIDSVQDYVTFPSLSLYSMYVIKTKINRKLLREDELVAEEIWNSPLFRAMLED